MRFGKGLIEIDRELSDLDVFAMDFIRILRKHSKYVIVSGYVSILLGRSRSSEDIDIIIPAMDFPEFALLFRDMYSNGFYCLNSDKEKEAYSYARDKIAIRFAKKDDVIPNIELKFSKNKADEISLKETLKVRLGKEDIVISSLEMQVAFKENVLGSQKDIEDAMHIRNVAGNNLKKELIEKYSVMLRGFYKG